MQESSNYPSGIAKITTSPLLVAPQYVDLDLKATTQNEAILEVANLLKNHPSMKDFDLFHQKLIARENSGSTYLGDGIALPHARTTAVDQIILAVGVSKKGIPFVGQDSPIHLIFVVGTPVNQITGYLATVGALARLLRQDELVQRLMRCQNTHEFSQLLPSPLLTGAVTGEAMVTKR